MIEALIRAARAGVKVRLNVRGVCCLKPDVKGAGIEVVRVVDRYLEHSRILYFHHGGKPLVFMSSADWMTRNLDKRIELLVPVDDPACRSRLMAFLEGFFRDTAKARRLLPNGTWERVRPPARGKPYRAQEAWYQTVCAETKTAARAAEPLFEPHRPAGR
jgi:polyphosphate kinase